MESRGDMRGALLMVVEAAEQMRDVLLQTKSAEIRDYETLGVPVPGHVEEEVKRINLLVKAIQEVKRLVGNEAVKGMRL
jgi:hypothetical protein